MLLTITHHWQARLFKLLFITLFSFFLLSPKPFLQAQGTQMPHKESLIEIKGNPQDQHAIFWSNLNTWIVDIKNQRVYYANHLYGKANHLLFEYLLTTQTKRRPRVNHPYGWIYRWISLDRQLLQSEFVDQLTHHFLENEVEGDFFDEHRILQFTNETVTLGRWVEQNREDQKKSSFFRLATAYTIDLSTREKVSASAFAEEKGKWLHRYFPAQLPACLLKQEDGVKWESSGRKAVYFDVFSSKLSQKKSCPQELVMMKRSKVSDDQKGFMAQKLVWFGKSIWYDGKLLSDQVSDALLHPSGKYAVILEGDRSRIDQQMLVNIEAIENHQPRFLALWQQSEPDQLLRFHQTHLISRLDGARWIPSDDLFLTLLEHRFKALEQGDCFQALQVLIQPQLNQKLSKYQGFLEAIKVDQIPWQQNICAVTGNPKAWQDATDLSARMIARANQQSFKLDIEVQDRELNPQDAIFLWFDQQAYPYVIKISQAQLYSNLSSHAQPKNEALLEYHWEKTEKGYFVSLSLPYAWINQKIAIAVQDHDPKDGKPLFLWLAGLGVEIQEQEGLEEGEREINSQDEVPLVDMPFDFSIEQEEEQFNALSVRLKSFRQYSEKSDKATEINPRSKRTMAKDEDAPPLEVDDNVISLSALNEQLKKLDTKDQAQTKNDTQSNTYQKLFIPLPQLLPIVEEKEK